MPASFKLQVAGICGVEDGKERRQPNHIHFTKAKSNRTVRADVRFEASSSRRPVTEEWAPWLRVACPGNIPMGAAFGGMYEPKDSP
jgi:hypothetical protein